VQVREKTKTKLDHLEKQSSTTWKNKARSPGQHWACTIWRIWMDARQADATWSVLRHNPRLVAAQASQPPYQSISVNPDARVPSVNSFRALRLAD
jgi:hypothetical protein